MSTSRSMELLKRRFAAPGLSRSATPPMSRLPRYDGHAHHQHDHGRHQHDHGRHQHDHDHYHNHQHAQGGQYCFQGDNLKPNTWCKR